MTVKRNPPGRFVLSSKDYAQVLAYFRYGHNLLAVNF